MKNFALCLVDRSDILSGLWGYQLEQDLDTPILTWLNPGEESNVGNLVPQEIQNAAEAFVFLYPHSEIDVISLLHIIQRTVVPTYERTWDFHLQISTRDGGFVTVTRIWFQDFRLSFKEADKKQPVKEITLSAPPALFTLAYTGYSDEIKEVQITAFRLGKPSRESAPFLIHQIDSVEGWSEGDEFQSGYERAHRQLAFLSPTQHFLVVDEDNVVIDTPDFSRIQHPNQLNKTFVFHARNPYNGLEYGHGGIKMFCKRDFQNLPPLPSNHDFTQWVASHSEHGMEVVPQVCSIHEFCTSPLAAAVTVYREVFKLAKQRADLAQAWDRVRGGESLLSNPQLREIHERLMAWCSLERYRDTSTLSGAFSIARMADVASLAYHDAHAFLNHSPSKADVNDLPNLRSYLIKEFSDLSP